MPERMDPWTVAWDWRAGGDDSSKVRAEEARKNAAARKRGLIGGAVGLAIAVAVYYFVRPGLAYVIAGVAIVLSLIAVASPPVYRKISGLLDRFAHFVGMAVTWVLMTILYYLLFFPVGLLLRARGKLAITRHPDRRAATYWTSTEGKPWTAESYRKQF